MRMLMVAALLGALLTSGCGRSADRAQIESVTARFLRAAGGGQGEVACAQLTPDAVKQLEQQEKGRCASSVGKLSLTPAAIRRVQIFAFNAEVELANGSDAFVERTADGWRLSAVACRPTQGDPRDHPMSCELES
jgi:hypothetical protein